MQIFSSNIAQVHVHGLLSPASPPPSTGKLDLAWGRRKPKACQALHPLPDSCPLLTTPLSSPPGRLLFFLYRLVVLVFFFFQKYFYFLQVTQMLPFCSALQSNAGIFEGARCSTSSRSPALLSLQKSPFKAHHQYFSAAVFLSCLNKAFKLRLLDVKPDSEAVSSFVYPQLVRGCFVLFWDGCLLQSCAFSSPFLPQRAAHSALCR